MCNFQAIGDKWPMFLAQSIMILYALIVWIKWTIHTSTKDTFILAHVGVDGDNDFEFDWIHC